MIKWRAFGTRIQDIWTVTNKPSMSCALSGLGNLKIFVGPYPLQGQHRIFGFPQPPPKCLHQYFTISSCSINFLNAWIYLNVLICKRWSLDLMILQVLTQSILSQLFQFICYIFNKFTKNFFFSYLKNTIKHFSHAGDVKIIGSGERPDIES